jgi:hypothetical protein
MLKVFLALSILLVNLLPAMAQGHNFRLFMDQVRVLKTRESSGDRPYFAILKFKSRLYSRNSTQVQLKLYEPHDWVSKPQYNNNSLRLSDHMSRGEVLALPWWIGDHVFTSSALAQTSWEAIAATINGLIVISLDNNNTPPHVVRNLLIQVEARLRQILKEQVETGAIINGITPSSPDAFRVLSSRVTSFSSNLTGGLDVNLFDWTFGSTFNPDKITGIQAFIFPGIAGIAPQTSEFSTSIVTDTIKIRSWFGTPLAFRQNIIFEGSNARYEVPMRVTTHSIGNDAEISAIRIKVKTGGDDLRRNSLATLRLFYTDGAGAEAHHDLRINNYAEWSNHSDNVVTLDLPRGMKRNSVRRAEIRFRSGSDGPFSSPDNWNLDALSIELFSGAISELVYNDFGSPLVRFTGSVVSFPVKFQF